MVALVVSGIVRNDKHGFALYLGDVAWTAVLIGALVTLPRGRARSVSRRR